MAGNNTVPIVLGNPIGVGHSSQQQQHDNQHNSHSFATTHLATETNPLHIDGASTSASTGDVVAPHLATNTNPYGIEGASAPPGTIETTNTVPTGFAPLHTNQHHQPSRSASNSSSSGNETLLDNSRGVRGSLQDGDASKEAADQAKPLATDRFLHDPSANSSRDHIADLGESHVSVRKGKSEFAALERRFSNLSQHSQPELQRSNTRRSIRSGFVKPEKVISTVSERDNTANNNNGASDAEKGQKKEEGEFDLAEVLRSGREKSDEAGIKKKRVGVVWEDLEVIGSGGLKINIRNFMSAIIEQFLMPALAILGLFGYKPFATKNKNILHKNSGLLKPGEMCLVLGRPGSGCSTFLKAITNQRETYVAVNGDVSYAGVGWKEMKKLYAG